jgi:prophage regulatory protein
LPVIATVFLLRLDQVCARVGLRKSTIYKLLASGDFPQPVRLGSRTSAWHASEVDGWIAGRQRVLTPRAARRAASKQCGGTYPP